MPWLSPFQRQERRRRWTLVACVFLLGFIAVTLADRWLFVHVRVPSLPAVEGKDWYRMLRVAGYLPTWLVVGAIVLAADGAAAGRTARSGVARAGSPSTWWSRGVLLMLAPALGGLAAEVLKVLFGRRRPIDNAVADSVYVWDGPFPTLRHLADGYHGGYGLPSSHAGVAFAAACIIGRLWPGAGGPALLLAAGCGVTRMLAGAHFASDVYVGAAAGYAVALGVWAMHRRGEALTMR